jgi:hypothetical protein
MRLKPALMLAAGPPGVWLLDEQDRSMFVISIHATQVHSNNVTTALQIKTIAADIAQALEDGLEVPDA